MFLDALASLELVVSVGGKFFVRYWINQYYKTFGHTDLQTYITDITTLQLYNVTTLQRYNVTT